MQMNVPNSLSMFRIVSIPLFIILLSYGRNREAFAVFIIAAATDALDGFFARLFQQKTDLGAYLDPIADKLLMTSSFVALSLLGFIPRWLSILVVSRDVIISMGIVLLRMNAFLVEIRPSLLSKCTTFLQFLSIGLTLLLFITGVPAPVLSLIYWATGILTVISGIHYIVLGLRMINEREA